MIVYQRGKTIIPVHAIKYSPQRHTVKEILGGNIISKCCLLLEDKHSEQQNFITTANSSKEGIIPIFGSIYENIGDFILKLLKIS